MDSSVLGRCTSNEYLGFQEKMLAFMTYGSEGNKFCDRDCVRHIVLVEQIHQKEQKGPEGICRLGDLTQWQ